MNELNGSPSPPSLSPSLSDMYSKLSGDNQRLFIKVFRYLWGYVLKRRQSYDIIHLFWLVDRLRIKYSLTNGQLSLLSYLSLTSERGKYIVKSTQLFNSSSLHFTNRYLAPMLTELKKRGYIVRLSRDPSHPYLTRYVSHQKIYIQLTGKGVALIDSMESELRRLVINSTIDDVTTANNKGQPTG